jgi:hypothetical protein
MTTIAVVFDQGSVGAGELLMALESLADPVFVVQRNEYCRSLESLFAVAGTVVELTGDTRRDVGALQQTRPAGIVTFSEQSLVPTAQLAANLQLPFHSEETVEALTNKYVQRRRLQESGVDETRYGLVRTSREWEEVSAEVGFPLVLKPAKARGSRNTHLIRDETEGREIARRLIERRTAREEHLIVEEYLVGTSAGALGDYVSVESICDGDFIRHVGITGKLPLAPPFRETGQFVPCALPAALQGAIGDLTSRALRALGVRHGITHTEVKLTAAGPRIIEVNGRIGGYIADLYRRATNVDLVTTAIQMALGETVDIPPTRPALTYFQYTAQPPLGAASLVRVDGSRSLLEHPGMTAYRQMSKPVSSLPDDMRTFDLNLICGEAGDAQGMLEALDECLPRLTFTFTMADREIHMNGAQLRCHNATHQAA